MLNFYTFFLFGFLLNTSIVFSQQNDTLKINLNHSNILIVNERGESNEWDFDEEINELKEDKEKKKASVCNVGLSLFSNSAKPWNMEYNKRIPYEKIATNTIG